MSIHCRDDSGNYMVRKYQNGKNHYIGVYYTIEAAEKAEKLFCETGEISPIGRVNKTPNKPHTTYRTSYTENYYQKLLDKQIADKNSIYNKYCVRRNHE